MTSRWPLRLAAAGLSAACLLLVWASVRAVRLEPAQIAPATVVEARDSDPEDHFRAATEPSSVDSAALHNLFDPDRKRGGVFHLPGDETSDPEPPPPEPPRVAGLKLLGTALLSDGDHFVVCESRSRPARIVRIGEPCGDLVLDQVARGRAEFRRTDGVKVVIKVRGTEAR